MRTSAAALAVLSLATIVSMLPSSDAAPVEVGVDVHVLSFGNYDTNKGTYVMDFYVRFTYDTATAPAGFDINRFEFMNGRAASRDLLYDNTTDGTREVWYRVQANLYSDPQFDNYPYDTQLLGFQLEDAVRNSTELVYVNAVDGNGLDEDAHVGGWHIDEARASIADKDYPFPEQYSRFVYTVHVSREPLSATLRSFLPPLAFMIVSGISFFFHPSKVAQRITLGTSMLISAVGFHISQTVSLPNLGLLTLFDKAMLATYAFLAASLVVTTAIAFNEDVWKKPEHSQRINRWGAAVSIALPIVVFGILKAM